MNTPDMVFPSEVADLSRRVAELPRKEGRWLIAVAGGPAGGKSVLAHVITGAVNAAGRTARAIPMDGFHLDNDILDARGLRARKGAPETFDADGFIHLMHRLKAGGEVIYPLFDRSRDLAVAGAGVIEADCDVAIVEGNYLLFDEAPWSSLGKLWDLSVWLDTPEEELRNRLVQRWLDHDHTPEEALARAESNDLPNAHRILAARLPADVTISAVGVDT
ncbi:nucleoside/nucleotide kinase family protein [Marinovum sp.]|uniref:nucleoside/nucleotide kinase family protein n=1 Tax=Marinovum sp. TaxID=2024839 RepID=UPI002B275E21|nr:nucleoside/nucleotide kinase family protein [Marinovum sp.]